MTQTTTTSRITIVNSWAESASLPTFMDLASTLSEKGDLLGDSLLGILYFHDHVEIVTFKEDNITSRQELPNLSRLIEARFFSLQGELHAWQEGSIVLYRIRVDGAERGEPQDIFVQDHIIWGTKVSPTGSLEEKSRGIRIPIALEITLDQLPLSYEVNNYFAYDADGKIYFFDARLVDLKNQAGESLHAQI